MSIPDGYPLLSVDPVLFAQVFVNLVENAAKYTPRGARIEIRARDIQGRLEIDIADDGPGIPVEGRERIFEKFYRGRPGRSEGFGLGLPICRGIVEAHGGTLTLVPSEKGACFRISMASLPSPLSETPPPLAG